MIQLVDDGAGFQSGEEPFFSVIAKVANEPPVAVFKGVRRRPRSGPGGEISGLAARRDLNGDFGVRNAVERRATDSAIGPATMGGLPRFAPSRRND
jgi:hypothetical protein